MQGCLHVYSGDGKGKTTAAVGLAVRAAGYGRNIIFAQFMKNGKSGEITVLKNINNVKIMCCDDYPFFNCMTDNDKECITCEHNEILKKILYSDVDSSCLIVLDEVLHAINCGLCDEALVKKVISLTMNGAEVVVTGRDVPDFIAEKADYATQMNNVRHPYDSGIMAREGVEY